MNAVLHISKADFKERIRKSSFLITLGLVIYLAYIFVPAADAGYVTLRLGHYRGIYNSAWLGCSVAISTATFLGLIGFYLVKNSIERDYTTRVGQIIAAAPISKHTYILGKTISNFAVLFLMTMITATAIIPMQLIRGEHMKIDLWAIYSPFLILVLPFMLLVAAAAAVFEVIPLLKGAFGNAVYFFLFMALLSSEAIPVQNGMVSSGIIYDVSGVGIILGNIISYAMSIMPDYHGGSSVGIIISNGISDTFLWNGMNWTAQIMLSRLFAITVAMLLVWMASIIFRRFDNSIYSGSLKEVGRDAEAAEQCMTAVKETRQSQLGERILIFGPMTMFTAELRLMVKGSKWWWYGAVLGLWVAQLLTPLEVSRQYILPVAWLLPLGLWSSLGARESKSDTRQLVFSGANIVARQLPALLLAGFAVSAATGSGTAIRLMLAGDWSGVAVWAASAVFIPSLAMLLGIWSGGSKLFEVIYTVLWYMGPMNKVGFLDYIGTTAGGNGIKHTVIILAVAAAMYVMAFVGRVKEVNSL